MIEKLKTKDRDKTAELLEAFNRISPEHQEYLLVVAKGLTGDDRAVDETVIEEAENNKEKAPPPSK
ncbi:MAG: hypothetical protein FWC13_07550 [Oscillospiraceae bacterium]|nr:hypothetical protein [Oscillospiraceae bacterium]